MRKRRRWEGLERRLFLLLGVILGDPRHVQAAFGDLTAFQLRLGHPGEDVVVAADVAHEVHRLAAPGVAVTGLAVPLLLRQARQDLLHVEPFVGVQALGFGELARVFQVAAADVVGGEGEPGAIRLLNAVRQLLLDVHQVLGAALDALLRVETVGHPHRLGGAQGQHHQAAHAGLGSGARLPERLLIAHRGEHAPVQAVFLGGLAKVLLVTGQALLQVLGKGVGAYVAEYVDMAVVALLEALQAAIVLGATQEAVDLLEQAGVLARCHRPAEIARVAKVEADPHVGEVHLVHGQFVGVDQGQVDLAFVDHAQQVDHLDIRRLFILQLRLLELQRGELLGMAAALEHQDAFADQVRRAAGAALAVAVDDLRGDFQIGNGKARALLAAFALDQAGGGQHRATRLAEAVEEIVEVVGGLDFQLHVQIVGEALDQLVFEAGFAVAILKVGGRAVAGYHAQHAFLLDPLQAARRFRAAAEHQE